MPFHEALSPFVEAAHACALKLQPISPLHQLMQACSKLFTSWMLMWGTRPFLTTGKLFSVGQVSPLLRAGSQHNSVGAPQGERQAFALPMPNPVSRVSWPGHRHLSMCRISSARATQVRLC